MKYKPHNLTSLSSRHVLAIVAAAVAIGPLSPVSVFGQVLRAAAEQNASAEVKPELTASELSASEVFAGVQKTLEGADSLTCKLQQTIMMSRQRFVAAGTYTQASGNRMRLEYRIFPVRSTTGADRKHMAVDGEPEDTSVLEESGSLQQVSDGSVLWTYWVNGTDKTLTRRNLQQIMDAVKKVPTDFSARHLQNLGVGGLKTLIAQIQTGIEFGAVQEQLVNGSKLLVLSGRWNQKTRDEIFKLPADGSKTLPEYVPDYVRIYVDANTMLPRRIQYLKKHPRPEAKQIRPMLTLDFRDTQLNVELAADTFAQPKVEDLEEVDVTSDVITEVSRLATAGQAKPVAPQNATPAGSNSSAN